MGGSGNGMKKIILIAFAVFLLTNGVFAAEVKNVISRQAGNRVQFEFDIVGEEKETDVSISLTINGKTYTAKDLHLEGDYGEVKVGKSRKIYWNVLQDFPRGYLGNIEWEIVARAKEYRGPIHKSKKLEVVEDIGVVMSINYDWDLVIIQLNKVDVVKVEDRLYVKNQKGHKQRLTVKRVSDNKVSAATADIKNIRVGMAVFSD